MNRILCVANYRASVGYAWWLMETFWAAIAEKYPGRVIVAFPQVDCHPQKLIDAGAEIDEYDFRVNATKYVRKKGIAHVYLTDRPYFSLHYWRLRVQRQSG